MAESPLGDALGVEDEKPEGEKAEVAAGVGASAEAFAAAVAVIASKQDPQVARDTSLFLQEQTALIKVQKLHLHDEHALRMAHLRNQLHEERLRRSGAPTTTS